MVDIEKAELPTIRFTWTVTETAAAVAEGYTHLDWSAGSPLIKSVLTRFNEGEITKMVVDRHSILGWRPRIWVQHEFSAAFPTKAPIRVQAEARKPMDQMEAGA